MKSLLAVLIALPLILQAQEPAPTPAASTPEQKFFATLAAAAPSPTKQVGNHNGGADFSETGPQGGILVGFDVWKGDYGDNNVVSAVRAVYQSATGRTRGKTYGRPHGEPTTVEANAGFAVAGIEARGGDRLDGFTILFWHINYVDLNLEADGAYKSELLGGNGGTKRRSPLTGNGRPVVGIFGGSGDQVDRLGLITAEAN